METANKIQAVEALAQWSTNWESQDNPFQLFLDLIGFNSEHFGGTYTTVERVISSLGYVELDYLGDALKCYAERPQDVETWLQEYWFCADDFDN